MSGGVYWVTPAGVLMLDREKVAEFVSKATAEMIAALLNAQRAEAAYFARKEA